MDSKAVAAVLDASAFYAGVPFGMTDSQYYTTPMVYNEIKHIKKSHDALGALLETDRLKIREPDSESTKYAIKMARGTGDYPQLSKQDISVIALSVEMRGLTVTDDFAISNVMKNIGLEVSPVMTGGIRDVGRWIHYCPGCRADQGGAAGDASRCTICGTRLKRKLIKR